MTDASAPNESRQRGPPPAKGRPKGSGSIIRTIQEEGTRAAARARQEKGARGHAAEELGDMAADIAYGDEEEMDGDPSDWARRCQATHTAWEAGGQAYQRQFVEYLAGNIRRSIEQAESYQRHLQSEIDQWCPTACSCAEHAAYSRSDAGEVSYYGRTCTFTLRVATFHCNCCSRKIELPPLAFGCFPSTPVQPTIWWELQLLHQYRKEAHESGLSMTGEQ